METWRRCIQTANRERRAVADLDTERGLLDSREPRPPKRRLSDPTPAQYPYRSALGVEKKKSPASNAKSFVVPSSHNESPRISASPPTGHRCLYSRRCGRMSNIEPRNRPRRRNISGSDHSEAFVVVTCSLFPHRKQPQIPRCLRLPWAALPALAHRSAPRYLISATVPGISSKVPVGSHGAREKVWTAIYSHHHKKKKKKKRAHPEDFGTPAKRKTLLWL
ncbi:hypothetical protein GGTG_08618 [Gaeumannomyces tritici R3-111a-1]|uniref:Uncharacterized protein n=1 Tax=Gaeumannomyces tritici (strain R3-111a-1) TaxID=644352 RepID=J3P532_GAET3|nr:hypothetical protein GGTG_08618 [Gaeumannomyces tritici R3-111a-1]EJT74780.1 hypothetical protein GGTG_08618 [Gaeumannomyces tritici R3-111a-1]